MFCQKCGHENSDRALQCAACGEILVPMTRPPMDTLPPAPPYAPTRMRAVGPPNHLVWAILVTLFCCLPGGIVAIVYAAQVDSKFMAGDVAGAQYASDQAKLWSWISAGSILVIAVGYFLLVMAAVIGGGVQ
jgi:hypothetical protein